MNVLVRGPGVQVKKILGADKVIIEIDDQKFIISPSNVPTRLAISNNAGGLLIRSVNLFTITVESA
jgi:hypothetical protein